MLGLSLMLMSFYLGQNVLIIVDVLSLLIGILQQVTSFIGFISFGFGFSRIWGLIASAVFTSWVCNLTSKHHRVDLYCGADGLLCAVFPKRCFGYGR